MPKKMWAWSYIPQFGANTILENHSSPTMTSKSLQASCTYGTILSPVRTLIKNYQHAILFISWIAQSIPGAEKSFY